MKNYTTNAIINTDRYTVTITDRDTRESKTQTMTGAELKEITYTCGHLYDLHAERVPEEVTTDTTTTTDTTDADRVDRITAAVQAKAATDRSAWSRGVTAYAYDLIDRLREYVQYGDRLDAAPMRDILLNGAADWSEYSWGGSSLIYDCDIAERLCNPTEYRRSNGGDRRPNRREEWLDVQARALRQAANLIIRAAREVIA